ncbi:MAG TPA: fructosamine kinase family protein [Burkholderiales bacterium]|nr:fructosamine kinase family protein [Burkholderiales bacterium]
MVGRAWDAVAASIGRATGRPFKISQARQVGGGCINRAFHLQGGGRNFFAKLNAGSALSTFEAEAAGLEEIAITATVRVPRPVCVGHDDTQAWLVLEYLPLSAAGPRAMAALGERLAAMHRVTRPRFGWVRDNTIGATPQVNQHESEWTEFWRRHRLGYQLGLAARNGYREALQHKGERLLEELAQWFRGYRPAASLLHGDLWAGNAAMNVGGEPVIFDPAVYYGDREADLAMTCLFGGFAPEFYRSYQEAWPLEPGHRERRDLYNLYHVLNHLNLFGGGYLRQAQDMMDRLLGACA